VVFGERIKGGVHNTMIVAYSSRHICDGISTNNDSNHLAFLLPLELLPIIKIQQKIGSLSVSVYRWDGVIRHFMGEREGEGGVGRIGTKRREEGALVYT
jgi:hypothetical protein